MAAHNSGQVPKDLAKFDPRHPALRFTKEVKEQFLAFIRAHGRVAHACESVGISTVTFYDHYHNDEEFKEAYDEAKASWCDTLDAEARRRAVDGCVEYYISKGEVVMIEERDIHGDPVYQRHPDTGEIMYNPVTGEPIPRKVPLIKKVYSDRLLELMLKRYIPAYRENSGGDGAGAGGGVLLIPAGEMTDEEYAKLYDAAEKVDAAAKADSADAQRGLEAPAGEPVSVPDN